MLYALGIVYLQKYFLKTREEWNPTVKSTIEHSVQADVTAAVLCLAMIHGGRKQVVYKHLLWAPLV